MMEKNKPCSLIFKRKALKGWRKLAENSPEAVEKCRLFLMLTPLDRLASNGKLKKLKGHSDNAMQYDVTDSARVRYWVDQENHVVNIEYAGPHP
jgi:mRNA-degrading endonuclease RelE of RelBE toxin-antitoxin system